MLHGDLGSYTTRFGHHLLLQEMPDEPTLTVENYCKWYCLFLVLPNGIIDEIDYPEDGFVDHVPKPDSVRALAEKEGWILHQEAEEIIIGRWQLEVL